LFERASQDAGADRCGFFKFEPFNGTKGITGFSGVARNF
jgi:hypothetical protein